MGAKTFGDNRGPSGDRWALSVGVSQDILNAAAAFQVGDGIEAGTLNKTVSLPMMGDVELSLSLTIIGVEFSLDPAHNGRLFASIRGAGDVSFGEGSMMPSLPGRALVRGDVLVSPRVELRPDGRFIAVLDLPNSELVTMALEGIEGAEADPGALAMMGEMIFGAIGGDVFSGLAEQMGRVGVELEPADALPLVQLGVRAAPADITIDPGVITVGLIAVDGVDGHAHAPLRAGQQAVVGVASGSLTQLARRLAEDSLGVPLPFDLDLAPGQAEVGARIRNKRLTSSPLLPDLRPGVRTSVAAKLVGDHIELSPREAWVELPLVPSFVNRMNQAFGSLASLAPVSVSLPAHTSIPLGDDAGLEVGVRVTELAMRPDGVSCVLEAVL